MRLELDEIALDQIEIYAEFPLANLPCDACGEDGAIVVIIVAGIEQAYDVCFSCAQRRGILW